jgi:hypothetical protein
MTMNVANDSCAVGIDGSDTNNSGPILAVAVVPMKYILSHKHHKLPVFTKVFSTYNPKNVHLLIFCNNIYFELFSGHIIWLVGSSNRNYWV